jgi:hypothetical protein
MVLLWKFQIAYAKGRIIIIPMSTVAEIEAAIEKLPPAEVRKVRDWLEERQQMLNSSEALFQMFDKEEQGCQSRKEVKSG